MLEMLELVANIWENSAAEGRRRAESPVKIASTLPSSSSAKQTLSTPQMVLRSLAQLDI